MLEAPGALFAVLTILAQGGPGGEAPWTELTRERVSAEEFGQIKAMMAAMDAELGPSKSGTRAEELAEQPPPADVAPEALGKLTERLARSWFFGMRMNRHLTIEGDLSFFPALASGTLDVQWTRVVGPRGKNVLAPLGKAEAAEAAERARAGFGAPRWSRDGLRAETQLTLTVDAERPGLVKAEGKARLKVPLTHDRFALPCAAGARATVEGRTATMRRCENDFLQVDWPGTDDPELVVLDASGRRLACGGADTIPVFSGGRSMLELAYADLPVKVVGKRISCNARGKVAAAQLVVPRTFAEKTVAVTATPEPVVDGEKPFKVAAPRTLWEAPAGLGLARTTPAAVRAGLKVAASRTYAMSDYNQPKVVVSLPRLDNSLYATMEFPEATLLDRAGKPVAHKEDSVWVQWPDLSNEVRFSPEGGEGVVDFARARGTVKVRYPVAMHTVTLTRAAPAAEGLKAEFKGPRVTITGESTEEPRLSAPSFAPHAFDLVRAYDAAGERLRQLGGETWYDDRHLLAFWGEPAEVRLVVADRWEDLEVPYDLAPAPLLPAGREGLKP